MRLARKFAPTACFAALLVAFAVPIYAADQTATVNGISKLFVRRGAGMEFPPFASLSEGSVVEIKAMEGEWAQVVTANGQVGYVQRRYLETGRGEASSPRATLTPTRRSTNTRTPRATKTPTVVRPSASPTMPRPTVTTSPTEIARRTATGTPATVVHEPTVAPTPTSSVAPSEQPAAPSPTHTASLDVAAQAGGSRQDGAIRDELRQLRVAVERLQRRLDEISGAPSSAIPMVDDPQAQPSSMSGGTVLLTLVGIVVGWALGSAYARNQERGRRSRIRF